VEDEIESGKASVNSLKRRQILKSQWGIPRFFQL
jgi:hypothetical protein